MKVKIKPAIFPIWFHFFILNFAFNFTYPYLEVQMISLGLTMKDVTLVVGCCPVIAFLCVPSLGYIGDKLGYKMVLIICMVVTMTLQTLYNFLPTYREFNDKIALNASFLNGNSSEFIEGNDVVWMARYVEDETNCQNEFIYNKTIKEVICDETSYNLDFKLDKDEVINTTNTECLITAMDSCKFMFRNDVPEEELIYCDVIFDGEDDITAKMGSHQLTFWSYFVLRVVCNVFIHAIFNISDATASILSRKERSSYSIMFLFGQIGSLIPQFIVGPIVDSFSLGSSYTDCLTEVVTSPKDYKIPFFMFDGFLLITAIFVFFYLDVEVEKKIKKKLSFKQEFYWVANPAAIAFYLASIFMGIEVGGTHTFINIYAQEELGATTTFLGYMNAARLTTSICVLPFAPLFQKKVGLVNTICLGVFVGFARCFAYAFPFSTPPYVFIGYGVLEGFLTFYLVSCVNYVGKIAPPELTATGISLQSMLSWIVGKGIGALVAGEIVDAFSIEVMFISFGLFGMGAALVYWILYHLVLKKYELDHTTLEGKKEEPEDVVNSVINDEIASTGIFYNTHF